MARGKRTRQGRVAPLVAAWLTLAIASGCAGFDPLVDAEMAALGPEAPGVPEGPLHRPGQPCGVCHREGGEDPVFAYAGTVYRDPIEKIAVPDATVVFIDAGGRTFTTTTNCVGTFYVKRGEFLATPPVWVSVQRIEFPWKMESPIHREVSCAKCHYDPLGPASAGHVYVTDDETTFASIPTRACTPADGTPR